MKKITFFFLLVFSQITFSHSKITETEKLAATCKVWGFLKYYHPKVANGEVNWDKQLLDILPKIDKAQTKEEFSLILENWIDDLGPIKEIAPIAVPKDVEYFDKNFDLSWINSSKTFSKRLSKKLKFIEENRFQGEQYYVAGFDHVENVFVRNENLDNLNYNEKNPRLVALFMYWNLIEYFFPYKYVMDTKWDKSLEELLPYFVAAKDEEVFYNTMEKLTVRLNDSHVTFFRYPKQDADLNKERHYLPFKAKIIDEKLIVTEILADSLAEADGIKIGDVITKVNDKTISEIISENRALVSASNEGSYLKNVIKRIEMGYTDSITLEFLKEDKYTSKTMKWYNYHDSHRNEFKKSTVKKVRFKMIDNNIGYVNMGNLKPFHISTMIEQLKSAKAIVFDMRNYPNGTFREISDFLNTNEKEFAIYIRPYYTYPGKYKWDEGTKSGIENNKDYYKGKVIVLLNEESISQSEWTAMCFQTAPNTTIIGSQTAGADGNVSDFDTIKAFYSRFTGLGVFYPNRRETQRIGIVPDIEVKPTIKGIQEGKDEVLDRALAFIETGK
ncbi:PDZ domain-containing protein [Flavobacterium sp. ANB]|uniref:S41 family peptidase n=1 Tax=unclassified Flavobacterium TaxID=196869 RepID=UPI0012B909DE|nr:MULTISPECIES: S41 family peptidase [unclassified Flavobacterium]MBF4515080.1 PDZ domain-containing protein [Flavobacterium sp. ANB]MTD69992.1 peptidase S41 [Flavobacterium sp. LC2016-13]